MQKPTHLNTGLTAAAFLLIGTLAVAQTAPTARTVKPREASRGQASGRQDQYGHASGVAVPQSNQATQRKSGSIIVLDREAQSRQASGPNSRNSAHATESVGPSNNAKKGENPLYEGSGKTGANPLYEPGKHKDGEDHTSKPTEFKQDFGPVQASKK